MDISEERLNQLFMWHTFDVRPLLPPGWQDELLDLAATHARAKTLMPTSVTSRESPGVKQLPVLTVGGRQLVQKAGWLVELYEGVFRRLGERVVGQRVFTAADERIKINLNVQSGDTMRYEAHVDSNPLEGLLYITDHLGENGGELAVAQRAGVRGVECIDEDAAVVYPKAGHLVFFDARQHAHYVRPLRSPDAVRVVAAMNFYTSACPESKRPADLNMHLFGEL